MPTFVIETKAAKILGLSSKRLKKVILRIIFFQKGQKERRTVNEEDTAYSFRSLFSYPMTLIKIAVPQGGIRPLLRKEIPTV